MNYNILVDSRKISIELGPLKSNQYTNYLIEFNVFDDGVKGFT